MYEHTCLSDSSVVECDKPDEVTNGRSSWDSQDYPKYGEIIQYVCNDGYTLVGNNSIVCGDTGEYDDQPPECKGLYIVWKLYKEQEQHVNMGIME